MPEDSRAFLNMVRDTAFGRILDSLGTNVGLVRSLEEDDMSYRRRIIAAGLGIPEEILREPEPHPRLVGMAFAFKSLYGCPEKPKPKLLTRFQILKNKIE